MPIGLRRITVRGKANDRWDSSRLRIVASFVIGYSLVVAYKFVSEIFDFERYSFIPQLAYIAADIDLKSVHSL